jgi:hypothetical protein
VLVIRAEQMKVFERAARLRFEDEMMVHSKAFSPRLCEVLGDDGLRAVVQSAIARADEYGFTSRGPVRLFLELMFLCGSAFDTDPQYEPAREFLTTPGDQMHRAQQLHEWHNDYLRQVSGPGAVNVREALAALLNFARTPLAIEPSQLTRELLREMKRIFPAKAAYVGESNLTAIVEESAAEAVQQGFEGVRATVLLAVLRFGCGHGCTGIEWMIKPSEIQAFAHPAIDIDAEVSVGQDPGERKARRFPGIRHVAHHRHVN